MAKNLSLAEKAAGIGDDLIVPKRNPEAPPKTTPGQLMAFREVGLEFQERIEGLEAKLAKAGEGARKAPISRLHKVAGRQRNLTQQERDELKGNMAALGRLITPLTVEPRPDGDWDILAGNNRYDFALELGWDELDIFVFEGTKEEADASAFYSNLLHPSLPDFEKYLGIKRIITNTGKTQGQVAEESGLTKDTVSRLMAFDRLSQETLEVIQMNQARFGSKLISKLAKISEEGRGAQAHQACVALAADENLTQEQAIELALKVESKDKPKKKQDTSKPSVVKFGKTNFASLRGVDKTLRIEFASIQDREELELDIEILIQEFVKKKEGK